MKKQEIMEQTNQNYYFNSKLYDTKLRRLAVFGREIDGKLEIFELTTSHSDQFCKKFAKNVYNYYFGGNVFIKNDTNLTLVFNNSTFHPNIKIIGIKEGNSAKYEFEMHTKFNYLHKYEETKLVNKEFYGVYEEEKGFKRVK